MESKPINDWIVISTDYFRNLREHFVDNETRKRGLTILLFSTLTMALALGLVGIGNEINVLGLVFNEFSVRLLIGFMGAACLYLSLIQTLELNIGIGNWRLNNSKRNKESNGALSDLQLTLAENNILLNEILDQLQNNHKLQDAKYIELKLDVPYTMEDMDNFEEAVKVRNAAREKYEAYCASLGKEIREKQDELDRRQATLQAKEFFFSGHLRMARRIFKLRLAEAALSCVFGYAAFLVALGNAAGILSRVTPFES